MSDKKPTVINARYLPPRLPLLTGVVLWLALDKLSPPGYVLGIAWTLYGLLALTCIVAICAVKQGAPRDIEPR